MTCIKKCFRFQEIKYPWVLLVSMILFVAMLFVNRLFPQDFAKIENIAYGIVCLTALLWALLNYHAHLKAYALCGGHNSVEGFLEQLCLSREEKEELAEYLNDFVSDLESSGNTHAQAVSQAIGQFQVKEFIQGNALQTGSQYYLLGYGLLFTVISFIIEVLKLLFPLPFFLSAFSFMFVCFGVGLIGLFFVYKLTDILLKNRMQLK